jgi:ABC-type lipoprotein export system ATPase subunit
MNETQTAQDAAVLARGLVKKYEGGRIVALDGLDLDVAPGEFVAICGPSGSGKSTLLNMITAIDRPDAGELKVCGRNVGAMSSGEADAFRASAVGLVFQLHNLLANLTALENVQVPMLSCGLSGSERVARAMAILEQVGLADRSDALPPKLSGGERQRVAVARALANRPALLLADEPTGALDSKTGVQLVDLLCNLQRDSAMTLVVVTHEDTVARRASRIVHMLDGKIVDDS